TDLVYLVRPNGKRVVHTVSTARPISTARSISTVRPVSTARQFAPKIAQTGSAIRPIYPRMDNVRPRASYSPIKRSYYTRPVTRPKDLKQDVKISRVKIFGSAIRPIYPRMDNVRPRASYSSITRSYYTRPVTRPKDLKQDVKIYGVKNMATAGKRALVNTGKGKMDNALKKSRWVWRPKGNYMDHESKEKGSFILKKFKYVDPKGISKSVMTWVPKRY
ncbi:hypothetical protein Tco_0896979, partial [Tanacetum coccineum]